MNNTDKIWNDINYRKNLSIGFFNSTNSAISLVVGIITDEEKNSDGFTDEMLINRVRKFRDIFIEDHKQYYASTIANIGQNYKAADSIAKLKATKTLEDLQIAWRLLSADERKDIEIRKVAQTLQATYKTNEKV